MNLYWIQSGAENLGKQRGIVMANNKRVLSRLFSVLFIISLLCLPFSGTVCAEESGEDAGTEVHADPSTFEKNYDLSVWQKEYTVTKCEKVVSEIIKPDMSALHKTFPLVRYCRKKLCLLN